jgi:peptidoglycan/xylan/chitin deacetylase (PgdA/CDA1 family)
MAALVRELVAILARATGVPWLLRAVWGRNKVTIIVYHDPKPTLFASHMAFIARRYNFIPLSDLVDALHSGDWSAIPHHALVVTIDDGHRGNYDLLPVFKQYKIRPTIYLCSRIAGTLRHYWFRDVTYEQGLALQEQPDKHRLTALQRICGFTPEREYGEEARQALSAKEIAEMQPWVDFQAHTCFHPILTAIEDADCAREIKDSKSDVEDISRHPCDHFCYPHGDYTQRELDLVKAAGYRSGRSMDLGLNDRDSDPYRLKIMGITDDASVNLMAVQLSGIPMWLRRALRGRFDGRHLTLIFEPTSRYR